MIPIQILFPHIWRLPLGKFKRNGYFCKDADARAEHQDARREDICAKWGHFSEQDVAALNGKADLVTQLAAKYGLPQAQAQREVDALLKGRQFGAGA